MQNGRSMRLQVLIEPEIYNKLFNMLREIHAPYKTESEAVRYAIINFLRYESDVKLTMYAMKQQLDSRKQQIEVDLQKIDALQADNSRLFKENQAIEIENNQLKEKVKRYIDESTKKVATKPRKKKSK